LEFSSREWENEEEFSAECNVAEQNGPRIGNESNVRKELGEGTTT
jgi:hypothetical protein